MSSTLFLWDANALAQAELEGACETVVLLPQVQHVPLHHLADDCALQVLGQLVVGARADPLG
eukprot:9501641-Pyramimonas_sp.AAC.1